MVVVWSTWDLPDWVYVDRLWGVVGLCWDTCRMAVSPGHRCGYGLTFGIVAHTC